MTGFGTSQHQLCLQGVTVMQPSLRLVVVRVWDPVVTEFLISQGKQEMEKF